MPARAPRILPLSILLTVASVFCRTAVAATPNLDGVVFFDKSPPDKKPLRNITPDLAIRFAVSDE